MGDIDDRWYRPAKDANGNPTLDARGKPVLEKTARHGTGRRYAARYRDPTGKQKSPTFDTVRDARAHLAEVETDKNRGRYIDHLAGRKKLADHVEEWLAGQTSNISSQHQMALRLRTHVLPKLGARELRSLTPSVIQTWMRGLQGDIADSYVRAIAANFSSVLQAAVDDGLIANNPFRAASVKAPPKQTKKVVPWSAGWVEGVRSQLPVRYADLVTVAAGLGLRQGEAFGLAIEDVDFLRGVVHVRRQVKLLNGVKFFDLPKRGKTRDVPLPGAVSLRLAAHLKDAPRSAVTLPWGTPDGRATEAVLIFRTPQGSAINRQTFSDHTWAPARKAAGIPAGRENGMHALRHYFASVVLAGGASIRDLADWLGHEDPGFTLRVYAHLMPGSDERMKDAIDRAFGGVALAAVAGK